MKSRNLKTGVLKFHFRIWAMLILASSLTACLEHGTDEATDFSVPPNYSQVTYPMLKAMVLGPFGCLGCHASFNTEAGLQQKDVTAHHPEISLLYMKVADGSMPQGGTRLSAAYVKIVETYIMSITVAATPKPLPPLEPTYASLKENLFEVSCVHCHRIDNPKLDDDQKDLSTYDGVKTNAARILKKISSTDPDVVMPPPKSSNPPPSAAVITTFQQWIDHGYPQN